jgi:hypothetical protein
MSKSDLHLLEHSSISIYVVVISLVLFMPSSSSFAHNNSTTIIPIARNPTNIDGQLMEGEWADANQENLTSAGVPVPENSSAGITGNYSILYLKYDFSERALEGAFDIPDYTPSTDKEKPDQVAFHFDTLHDTTESLSSDDHMIVITRNKGVEHYIGDPNPSNITSIKNSTLSMGSMDLLDPFSRIDFSIINSSQCRWSAEFKIYFENDFTQPYGFSMQQVDFHPPPRGLRAEDIVPPNTCNMPAAVYNDESNHINFPRDNRTNAYVPSTWGDITLVNLHQILENIRNLCPSKGLPVGSNILCIDGLSRNQITANELTTSIALSGKFADFINNSGIDGEKYDVYIVDSNTQVMEWISPGNEPEEPTLPDGKFSYQLNEVSLDEGNYLVVVDPTSDQYNGLNATAQLIVNERALTLDEVGGYIQLLLGIAGGIIGVVVAFPPIYKYFAEGKRKSTMHDQI